MCWLLAVAIVPVSELTFRELPSFLSLETQRGNRSSLETFEPYFLAGFIAIAIAAIVNT
jgi:hypothetical protein